jgi:DGQHR domain-containing protein
VQRAHDESRSTKIRDYVRFGYPWSDLPERRRRDNEFSDLRKPGWLPTALVINILRPGDVRDGATLRKEDAASISNRNERQEIIVPSSFSGKEWQPQSLHPFEVIDGQHRLWAFDDLDSTSDFELPVVAFDGLDRSWQAYLFWTVNITPKKISPSLAFDLYPLLRTEEWLNAVQGLAIYRETRAQELVENLWAVPESPWHQRINMLGESGLGSKMVTQAAWIRSLMATFVKPWEGHGRGKGIGGLFGAPIDESAFSVLSWSRAQQAAFLIQIWSEMRDAVRDSKADWAKALRAADLLPDPDPAFYGEASLINSDQGVRGILAVFNDLFFVTAQTLELGSWEMPRSEDVTSADEVGRAIVQLRKRRAVCEFARQVARGLAESDWRTSAARGLSEEQRLRQAVFRGGPGYKEIKVDRLKALEKHKSPVGEAAREVVRRFGY